MVTQGSSIGVSTQEGGDKTVKLYNITGDGTVGSYVNAVGGAWYNWNWSLGGVRGSGTNLDRAQLNVNSGAGTAGSFLFYPDERFKSSSCGADGAGYGGSWSDINTWQRNISFLGVTYPLIMMLGLFLLPVGIVNAVVDILQQ